MPYDISASFKEHLMPAASLPSPKLALEVEKHKIRDLHPEVQEKIAHQAAFAGLKRHQVRASVLTPVSKGDGADAQASPDALVIGPTWRRGSFGRVRPAWDGEALAAKELRLPQGKKFETYRGKRPKTQYSGWGDISAELDLLRAPFTRLHVKHVVRSDHRVFVFTPWLPLTGHDLQHAAHRVFDDGAFPLYLAHEMLKQIGGQVADLNANGYLHNDIKAANILASAQGPLTLVLGDFGLAERHVVDSDKELDLVGTPGYISPERLRLDTDGSNTDAYSLAVMAIETIIGQRLMPSYSGLSIGDLHKKLVADSYILEDWHAFKFGPEPQGRMATDKLTLRLDTAYAFVHALHPRTAELLFEEGLNADPAKRFTCDDARFFGARFLDETPAQSQIYSHQIVRDAVDHNDDISARDSDFFVMKSVADQVGLKGPEVLVGTPS